MSEIKSPSLASRLDMLPLSRWHVMVMAICGLGLLFDNYDLTIMAVALPSLISEWKISPVEVGMLASGAFAGMVIGGLLFGVLADAIGRRTVFQITLLIYALLTGACALTSGFTSMLILRFMVGLGMGGLVPVDSAYLAEYVPSRWRGRLMGWFAAFSPMGNALSFLAGFFVVVHVGWRWGFVLGIIPAFIVILIRRGLPESVRYLVQKGRIAQAAKIVERLEQRVIGKATVPHEEAVAREELARSVSTEAKVRVRDLFRGGLAISTIMICALWFCVNYVVYGVAPWLPILLMKELGYPLGKGFVFLAIANLVGMIGQFTVGFNTDLLGRRPTVAYSVILLGLAPYFLFWLGKNPSLGPVLLIILYIGASSSLSSLYVYTPENFPTKVRGAGMGFAGTVGRGGGMLGATIMGIVYPKAGLFWALNVNMSVLIIAAIIVLTLGRETRGRTLEQISAEQIQLKKVPA